MNFKCLVLCLIIIIDRYNPTEPPKRAREKRVFSGIRRRWRIDASLSIKAVVKATIFIVNIYPIKNSYTISFRISIKKEGTHVKLNCYKFQISQCLRSDCIHWATSTLYTPFKFSRLSTSRTLPRA